MLRKFAVFPVFIMLAGGHALGASPLETCLERGEPAALPTEAIEACTDALEGNLSKANRGRALLHRGMWRMEIDATSDDALADFSKVLEVDPSRYTPYLFRALIHVEAERFDEALVEIAKFMKRDQGDTHAWIVSGRANLGAGNTKQAISDLTRALKLDGDGADILYHRGLAHQKAGDREKALRDWDKAIELDPNYDPPRVARAGLLAEQESGTTAE